MIKVQSEREHFKAFHVSMAQLNRIFSLAPLYFARDACVCMYHSLQMLWAKWQISFTNSTKLLKLRFSIVPVAHCPLGEIARIQVQWEHNWLGNNTCWKMDESTTNRCVWQTKGAKVHRSNGKTKEHKQFQTWEANIFLSTTFPHQQHRMEFSFFWFLWGRNFSFLKRFNILVCVRECVCVCDSVRMCVRDKYVSTLCVCLQIEREGCRKKNIPSKNE